MACFWQPHNKLWTYRATWRSALRRCPRWGHRCGTPQGESVEPGSTECPDWDPPASGAAPGRRLSGWLTAWTHPDRERRSRRVIYSIYNMHIYIFLKVDKPCRWRRRPYRQLWPVDPPESWSTEPRGREGGSFCLDNPEGLWSVPKQQWERFGSSNSGLTSEIMFDISSVKVSALTLWISYWLSGISPAATFSPTSTRCFWIFSTITSRLWSDRIWPIT